MSSYLRKLLNDSPEPQESKPIKVKTLPQWLQPIQSQRPVTYDTSELYEDRVDESDKKKQSDDQMSKKCYECGEFGHIAKECPNKWKKKLGGRFKESDWCCPMCGNINWDWRQHCNKCSTPKPTGCNAEKRTGKGGGYNEIDDETRKRLQSKRNETKHKKEHKSREYPSGDDPVIYISNLPHDTDMDEEELITKIAQLFGQIGRIKKDYRARSHCIRLSNKNRNARLVYEDSHTAPFAIQWFDGTEFEGNTIGVKLRKDVEEEEAFGVYEEERETEQEEQDEYYEDKGKDVEEESVRDRDDKEIADIEAELFGYSRRGRGKGRTRGSRRKGTREKSRSRSREKERDRDMDRDRGRGRHRERDRTRYRPSNKNVRRNR
eukprot:105711_1